VPKHFSSGMCDSSVRALVVLGSGGHTAEMMTMLNSLVQQKMQFRSVLYALAATDSMSRFKAENSGIRGEFAVVPRAREVGQSYISSAFTTAHAFAHSFVCVMRYRPQLLLCNGPGTCVPFALAVCVCRYQCNPRPPLPPSFTFATQVLRAVPLLHSVRRVFRARAVAVCVRPHYVPRCRQVRGAVGAAARAVPPRSVCRRPLLKRLRPGKKGFVVRPSSCFVYYENCHFVAGPRQKSVPFNGRLLINVQSHYDAADMLSNGWTHSWRLSGSATPNF
jgi:hypothetical protein